MEKKYKVIVVDDQSIFRKGLVMLLKDMPEVEMVAEAANGQEFLDYISLYPVDIVFIDIKMPVMDGIEATKIAMARFPKLKMVVVSMYGEEEYILSMLEAGVKGFVLKTVEEDEFHRGIREVIKGKNFFSSELLDIITKAFVTKTVLDKETEKILEDLTQRELEVIALIAQGYSIREIAKILNVSTRSIDNHKTSVFRKTNTQTSVQLIAFAIKHRLIKV
ncbi:MAG: response regulator transcription factor [Bacteroidales bacterium]|nr:response regulator transcription factor [Bacteroidales bacterium]